MTKLTGAEFIRKRFNVPGTFLLREYFGVIRWDVDTVVELLDAFASEDETDEKPQPSKKKKAKRGV